MCSNKMNALTSRIFNSLSDLEVQLLTVTPNTHHTLLPQQDDSRALVARTLNYLLLQKDHTKRCNQVDKQLLLMYHKATKKEERSEENLEKNTVKD